MFKAIVGGKGRGLLTLGEKRMRRMLALILGENGIGGQKASK